MKEYAARTALGSIVAVAVAVGLGIGLSNAVPNSPSSAVTNSSIACNGGVTFRGMTWMITYNLTDGSIQGLGSPCGGLGVPKGMGAFDVTSNPMLPIMLTNGWTNTFYVNLQTKQIAQIPGVTFSSDYMQAFYNGKPIINGTRLPTPYSSSSSITTSGTWCTYLDGTLHPLLTPLKSGPIYFNVLTDQLTPVTDGTIYVSNRVNLTNWLGSNNYCISLSSNPNGRGYIQVTERDSRLGNGVYNFTLIAEYGVNQSFKIAIPDIVVQPNTTMYVTISIPSGEVTTVTMACNQGNTCTQTTSTSSAKG